MEINAHKVTLKIILRGIISPTSVQLTQMPAGVLILTGKST